MACGVRPYIFAYCEINIGASDETLGRQCRNTASAKNHQAKHDQKTRNRAKSTESLEEEPYISGAKEEVGSPKRPHDAHDAGSSGLMRYKPNKMRQIHAVGNVCGFKCR